MTREQMQVARAIARARLHNDLGAESCLEQFRRYLLDEGTSVDDFPTFGEVGLDAQKGGA